MTVNDLIEKLKECDLESSVEISVGAYNKQYPIDYLSEIHVINKQNGTHTRLFVSLPFSVSVKKISV